jgi:hypothetical protein
MHLVEARRLVLEASRLAGADRRRVSGDEIVVGFDLDAVAGENTDTSSPGAILPHQ